MAKKLVKKQTGGAATVPSKRTVTKTTVPMQSPAGTATKKVVQKPSGASKIKRTETYDVPGKKSISISRVEKVRPNNTIRKVKTGMKGLPGTKTIYAGGTKNTFSRK